MRRARRALFFALCVVCCAVASRAFAQSEMDFLDARAAFERGDRIRLDALAPKLANHVLAPYVEFWRIRLRPDAATDDEIAAYLARWPKTPLADRLRVEWLKTLGKGGLMPGRELAITGLPITLDSAMTSELVLYSKL